ncbi:MAG: radical SAM protein [Chitinophagales bacterium]
MNPKVFLITPPFTQLNTPYPATAYLKGYLNTLNVDSSQSDLGIEVILQLFSTEGLSNLFEQIEKTKPSLSKSAERMVILQKDYIHTIDPVIRFLQYKNPTLAYLICTENYLPAGKRFDDITDLEWAFGNMGAQDKARHLATLYLEDISDLIIEAVDPLFGFSRYAERLSRSANSFDELYEKITQNNTFIDEITLRLLARHIEREQPDLVAFSVPFPGNLYSALKNGQWIKQHYPHIKVAMGGGFVNTELRSLKEKRVFEMVDFICLDDGEAVISDLLEFLQGSRSIESLKRTFALIDGNVTYCNNSTTPDVKQKDVGTPDYSGLPLKEYLSVIAITNPMHRLWNDGRWNKMTLAHGCYWGKCTFCDITLDYIKVYEATTAKILVDRMEALIAQTGENGFHFVDEAAPPALMKEVAIEIIRRNLTISWWTNIRFEKSFTLDLCKLLSASGCIAISGGLEVASDRLLKLIDKGVSIKQVAKVADHFMEAGIMVHAYLMYGFPTQTAQETIDSLEIVRQLFMTGVVQSAYWHQFAMTAHSPIGIDPAQFKVVEASETKGDFANNDIIHIDPTGADHEQFSVGLKKALFNYMHGICFEYSLQDWFDFKVPDTTIDPDYIEDILEEYDARVPLDSSRIIYLGIAPTISVKAINKRGKSVNIAELHFNTKYTELTINFDETIGKWLLDILPKMQVHKKEAISYKQFKQEFENFELGDFTLFWHSNAFQQLRDIGLLVL